MQPLFCKLNLNNLPPHDILSPRQHHFSSCLFTRCFPGCSRLRIDRLGKTIQYVYDIQNGAYEELEHAVDRDPDSSLQLDEFVDHCVMKYFDTVYSDMVPRLIRVCILFCWNRIWLVRSQSIKPGSGAERYRRGSLARSRASDKQKICTFFLLSSDSSLNKSNATILLYSPIDCGPIWNLKTVLKFMWQCSHRVRNVFAQGLK